MNVTTEKTVRDMLRELPETARVFEKFGIDYCCGGNRTLEEACKAASVPLDAVLPRLEACTTRPSTEPARDWESEPLADLISHIVETHHKYTREEIARLGPLFDRVCAVHGSRHAELESMRAVFQALAQELTLHMMKEERVLFPYIVRMEESVIQHEPVLPAAFVTVQHPVKRMESEHEQAGTALRLLRKSSNDYTVPPNGCASYQTLYRALEQFEADMHQHIHLENNILFPRAIEMEKD